VAGAVLLLLGVPAVVMRVRQRPDGFLPVSVVRNAAVVRSALSSAAIPAAWFALLIAVPAVLIGDGWQPVQVGLVLLPSALTGLLAPLVAGPLLGRIGPSAALAGAGAIAAVALAVAAWGAGADSVLLLVVAVVIVTGAFGLGQPALGAAVGRAVTPEVRGVALGVATLVFLVGAGIGSAVVGGLGEVMGIPHALLLLALFPLAGVVSMLDHTRRSRAAGPTKAHRPSSPQRCTGTPSSWNRGLHSRRTDGVARPARACVNLGGWTRPEVSPRARVDRGAQRPSDRIERPLPRQGRARPRLSCLRAFG
jgi:MFS family permease